MSFAPKQPASCCCNNSNSIYYSKGTLCSASYKYMRMWTCWCIREFWRLTVPKQLKVRCLGEECLPKIGLLSLLSVLEQVKRLDEGNYDKIAYRHIKLLQCVMFNFYVSCSQWHIRTTGLHLKKCNVMWDLGQQQRGYTPQLYQTNSHQGPHTSIQPLSLSHLSMAMKAVPMCGNRQPFWYQ